MVKSGWGRVINTGSMHALVASPYKSAYNAAKHGIAGAGAVLERRCTKCKLQSSLFEWGCRLGLGLLHINN